MSSDFVTHLECAYTGEILEKGKPHTLSPSGMPLLVRYDLKRLANEISREKIENCTEPGFWRYSPLLPVTEEKFQISLGEVVTPLIPLNKSVEHLGLK
ncbi:MAG: threonine synthase, partial [Candidatus Thermoplasmatota archaeon]|nr:threonine synthase [Candidatus Thermoplasmatota archaeon]